MFLSFVCFKLSQESTSLVQRLIMPLKNQFVRSIFQANENIALNKNLLTTLINNLIEAPSLEDMFIYLDLLLLILKRNEFAALMIFDIGYLEKVFELITNLARSTPTENLRDSLMIAQYDQIFVYSLRLTEFILESRMQRVYFLRGLGPMVTQSLIESFQKVMLYLLNNKDRIKFLEPFYIGNTSPAKAKDLEESLDVILKIFRQAVELSDNNLTVSNLFSQISKMIGFLNMKKGVINLSEIPDKVEDLQKMINRPLTINFQVFEPEQYPAGVSNTFKSHPTILYKEFLNMLEEELVVKHYKMFYVPLDQEFIEITDSKSFQKMITETIYLANSLEVALTVKMIIKFLPVREFIRRYTMLRVRDDVRDFNQPRE
jgi:hypothetical protein